MDVLVTNNLTKLFGQKAAVELLNLTVQKGEVFGFLGPNGAGKTTTIRCMMDFLRPTSGSITILGLDAQKDSVKLKREIGYVSSDSHLYSNWTGEDHLKFLEDQKGKSKLFNLPDLIKQFDYDPKIKVKHLSTGNKQKLNILLSLIGDPKLLILDEPTQGLDPILQNEFYTLIQKFKMSGGTIFMSSHNLPEVEHICDRIGIIKEGKIIALETLESIKEKNIYEIRVSFEKPVDPKLFKSEDITITHHTGNILTIKLRGQIDPFINKLTKYKIKDLEITHANLEEIFMEYYK